MTDDELKTALENLGKRNLEKSPFDVINKAGTAALPGLIDILRQDDRERQELAIAIL